MDMGDSMAMGGAPIDGTPLNSSGVDFSNSTQASDFLGQILDDTMFQVDGNMYARNFWYGVVTVIGICAFFDVAQKATFRLRMRAAAASKRRPAAPSNAFSTAIACLTAIGREAGYAQWTPMGRWSPKVPPVGTVALLVGYLVWIILLEFADNSVAGAQHYTSLGVRAAWLSVAQVPLLILLAGKNNLIGLVSGVSYERLNVLHRWVSRGLLFLVTLHVIFLHLAWNAYGLGPLEYATDSCIPTGWAVYAILIWMNISTIAPIRNFSYEFFVVQHIITFCGFIVAVMFHLPSTALYSRVYIYIPIVLYFLDRASRSLRYAYNNVRPGRATLTAMEGGVTKVCVQTKAIGNWTPGSHVFLSIPKFGIGQSHPATIASTPHSHNGDLVFILKGHKGFTSRLLRSATTSSTSLLPTKGAPSRSASVAQVSHIALLDGPYGSSHSNFTAFDTVLLIAGSTGITFILPILLGIAHTASTTKVPVRRITFLWIVKNTSWTSWVAAELASASQELKVAGIELDIKVHVTCDDAFTTGDDNGAKEECGCECDKSLGPCCCVNVEDEDEISPVTSNNEKSSAPKDAKIQVTSRTDSTSSLKYDGGVKSRVLPCAYFYSGRPNFYRLLGGMLEVAEGESGVAVCGPLSLNADVRRTVVRLSDERAVHKGTGAQGVYLHAECFGW